MKSACLLLAALVAGCAGTTALAIPRRPGEVFARADNGGELAVVANGSVEDVYRRAALLGCTREGARILCQSRHATTDAMQRARFTVGTADAGEVVVVVAAAEALTTPPEQGASVWAGPHDELTLRRLLLTLAGSDEERTPPAPPPLH